MKKKMLALFLSLTLCLSLLPAALAAGKSYEEAVKEFREEDSMRTVSQTFESDYGTIFIYGSPNPHGSTGSLIFITKAPCAKGEGERISLPHARHSLWCNTKPPQTAVLSDNGKTFTYTYYYDEALVTPYDQMLRAAGDFIYTLDLTTGEVTAQEPQIPEGYHTYAAALERTKTEEGWTVEQTLETPLCTVLLRYFTAEDGRRSYFLDLVYKVKTDSFEEGAVVTHNLTITRNDGTGEAGFPVYYTHRAPDTLTLSEDKTLLTYTYSESLEGGPDTETLELATGYSDKFYTLPTVTSGEAPEAADPQAAELAGKLKTLGLFLGDEQGNFHLDKTPTRAEALVMLIRALGEEPQAKAAGKTHPFTDVPAWADGYVSWGYAKGYTKGVSATEFGANTTAGAEMYLTFMLRALGYTEGAGGQFTWDQPYLLAYEAEILPFEADYAHFTRGDAVLVTSAALWAHLAGSDKTLSHRLVEQGSFPAADFSAQFPQDPFSWEHALKPLVAGAMEEAEPTGQTDRKNIQAQAHIIAYALNKPEEEQIRVYALAGYAHRELNAEGDSDSSGSSAGYWTIDFSATTGQVLSCVNGGDFEDLPFSTEEWNARSEFFFPVLRSAAEAKLDALAASGEVGYQAPTYDQAVAELQTSFGYYNEKTFETPDCTVFVFDRGGMMNAPTGAMTVIYKAGSSLGEGHVLSLPHVRSGWSITPADTMELSADQKTFTYSYFYDTTAIDSSLQGDDYRVEPGTVTFTVDLPTGEIHREYRPVDYAGAMAHVTRKRNAASGEDREVVKTLESNFCTVVLTKDRFVKQYDDYTLSLVYKPDSPLGNGAIRELILPSTVYDEGYSYSPTDRAPDSLSVSQDGKTLTYIYRFDEALEGFHDAGTYTYTVDLATGELNVTHTPN